MVSRRRVSKRWTGSISLGLRCFRTLSCSASMTYFGTLSSRSGGTFTPNGALGLGLGQS